MVFFHLFHRYSTRSSSFEQREHFLLLNALFIIIQLRNGTKKAPYREAVFYINLFYFFGKMFLYMEPFAYFCIKIKVMEVKAKFKVVYSKEADDFLNHLPSKIKDKIIYNIAKAKFVIDPELFKKLDDTDIWEFRTFYKKVKYRLLAFWDKDNGADTLVIATHGFIKKTQKTPPQETAKAEEIRKAYFNSKK